MSRNEEMEKSSIRECLEQLWTAYKNSDAGGIARLYHSNANLVLQGQEVAVGRQEIEREYAKLLAIDPFQSETKVNQALRIHLVTDDLAVVDTAAGLTRDGSDGTEEKLGEVFFTITMVKEAGQWRIAAMRGANGGNLSAP